MNILLISPKVNYPILILQIKKLLQDVEKYLENQKMKFVKNLNMI